MRIILTLFIICFLPSCVNSKNEEFLGVIEYTAKAKDVSSLCYSYTFTQLDKGKVFGVVVSYNEYNVFKELLGKKVKISGYFVEKERKFFSSEQEQIPLNFNGEPLDVDCKFFNVKSIKVLREK